MTEDHAPLVCFLSDNETHNELCLRYWSLGPHGKWKEPFNVLLTASGLGKSEMTNMLKSACQAFIRHLRCNKCNTPIQVSLRSEYSPKPGAVVRFGKRVRAHICATCAATEPPSKRRGEFTAERQKRDRAGMSPKYLDRSAAAIDFGQLSYVQSFFLYAVLVAADIDAGNRTIPPPTYLTAALAPTAELAEMIYTRLYADGLLYPTTSVRSNPFSARGQLPDVSFDVRSVFWTLADDLLGRSTDEVCSLLFRRLEQPEPDSVKEIWYVIAQEECKSYFLSQCERYRFVHPEIYTTKVAAVIRLYLDRCSIGQTWNIIYYAIKNLAALAQEGIYMRQHIYNMMPGSIRRYADYRLGNGNRIHPWRRPSPTTQSWVTSILLDKILKQGDLSFEMLTGHGIRNHVELLLQRPESTVQASPR